MKALIHHIVIHRGEKSSCPEGVGLKGVEVVEVLI